MAMAIGGFCRFWGWYQGRLAQRPLQTQVVTSGLLWAIGDVMAQTMEARIRLTRSQLSHSVIALDSRKEDSARTEQGMDWMRAGKISLFGVGFVGPVGHYWYEALDSFVRTRLRLAANSWRFVGAKLFLDEVIFGPIHPLVFFTYMGLVSGKSLHQIKKDLQRDYLPALLTESSMWFMVQIANFRFVPVRHQLLLVNCVCVFDSAFLSWVKHQDDAPWKSWVTSFVVSANKEENSK